MTNVWTSPEKVDRRSRLFEIGLKTMERQGWTVERAAGLGGSSVRRIRKNGKSQLVSIRTTQDKTIAFPRNEDDTDWITLSDVDVVLAVSVDDRHNPRFALVHWLPGDEMRDRFNRTYAARKKAGHTIPLGRGVWLALYEEERNTPVHRVGAGAGLAHKEIATVPLDPDEGEAVAGNRVPPNVPAPVSTNGASDDDEPPLTIADAKRRLARTLGVDPGSIKITVEA